MFNVIVLRGDYSALIKQMFKMDAHFFAIFISALSIVINIIYIYFCIVFLISNKKL